ncbi:helix-turn-helix domain-containing protein [Amycolatopsis sp. NPDC004378]
MNQDNDRIGARIALHRKAVDWTQRQLANRAAVSLSLLQKVEVGDRAATPALLAAVARAFGISTQVLTGQPYADNSHDVVTATQIEQLRTVLRRYDLPTDGLRPRPLPELASDVRTIAKLRAAADYGKLAVHLPGLIDELTAARHHAAADGKTAVNALLVTVYHAAHTLLYRLGYLDLAEAVEHKLDDTANATGDPLALGLARWTRAQSFQSAGDYDHGLRLMDTARAELDDLLRNPAPAAITMYGSLHLRAVTLASRAGDADTTQDHLDAATELASRFPSDRSHLGLTFGPANVATHAVAAHVELGNPEAALAAAERWRPPRTMPRTRRGHHHIGLARAHLLHGDRNAALGALQQARRIAPQQTRLHPMVRETTAVLLSLHRRSNPELSGYATWLGLA